MSETEATAVETEKGPTRSGFVALIGATNAGKSTLVNKLVGAKVSIVSHKVQTTRAIVRGIAIHKNAQIVFMDTPGIFKPRRRLDRAMVTTAWGGAKDADAIMMLIDSERGLKGDAETILEGLKHVEQPKMLVLNKIDQVEREDLLKLATAANEFVDFERTFMISALTGSGCDDVLDYLAMKLPEGPWYYPEDQISDLPMRQLAAEITREKLFLRLHQELPYSSARTAMRSRRSPWPPARNSRKSSNSRSTCSCSSRSAKTGATTPSVSARWAWNSRSSFDPDESRRRLCQRGLGCLGLRPIAVNATMAPIPRTTTDANATPAPPCSMSTANAKGAAAETASRTAASFPSISP
jgi:GTP-binding protein Era